MKNLTCLEFWALKFLHKSNFLKNLFLRKHKRFLKVSTRQNTNLIGKFEKKGNGNRKKMKKTFYVNDDFWWKNVFFTLFFSHATQCRCLTMFFELWKKVIFQKHEKRTKCVVTFWHQVRFLKHRVKSAFELPKTVQNDTKKNINF